MGEGNEQWSLQSYIPKLRRDLSGALREPEPERYCLNGRSWAR